MAQGSTEQNQSRSAGIQKQAQLPIPSLQLDGDELRSFSESCEMTFRRSVKQHLSLLVINRKTRRTENIKSHYSVDMCFQFTFDSRKIGRYHRQIRATDGAQLNLREHNALSRQVFVE